MSAQNTNTTPLSNLFDKFLKDASKLCNVKKDTECLISQIVAHMATPECQEDALMNLERIFQRSFRVTDEPNTPVAEEDAVSSTILDETKVVNSTDVKEKKKSGPKKAKKEEVPVVESLDIVEPTPEVKEKKKPGPKKAKKEEVPVVESTETPEIKEKKKPGPKKAAKTVSTEETPVDADANADAIARLVKVTNEVEEELTEEDLLEIVTDSDTE